MAWRRRLIVSIAVAGTAGGAILGIVTFVGIRPSSGARRISIVAQTATGAPALLPKPTSPLTAPVTCPSPLPGKAPTLTPVTPKDQSPGDQRLIHPTFEFDAVINGKEVQAFSGEDVNTSQPTILY
jgi:hypothetical protein